MILVLMLSGLGLLSTPGASASASELIPGVNNALYSETEALFKEKGLPDLTIPVPTDTEVKHEDYFLLYESDLADTPDIDELYYVEPEIGITYKINELDPDENKDHQKSDDTWWKETLEDIDSLIDDLKVRKDTLDTGIHSLPGLYYFDRVDLLRNDMELGWGKGSDQFRTTLIYETDQDSVNLLFQVPIQ